MRANGVEINGAHAAEVQRALRDAGSGVLAARIDRLPRAEKELLQSLAVIGKEFSLGLVHRVVAQSEDQLRHLLSRLEAGEFIYERPTSPDIEYTFKHPLTREVAGNSLLMEQRTALHERTAPPIEVLFQPQLKDHYSELARHYSLSGMIRKLWSTCSAPDSRPFSAQPMRKPSAN